MALKPEPTAPFHSVQYALRVLETVARHTGGVTDVQIARETGLPAVHLAPMLLMLRREGYVLQVSDGAYAIGDSLVLLGSGVDRQQALQDKLQDTLDRLRDSVGAAVYISRYVDGEVRITQFADSPRTPKVHEWVDFRSAAHASAVGKCLLTQLDLDGRRDHLSRHKIARLTSKTIVNERILFSKLDSQPANGAHARPAGVRRRHGLRGRPDHGRSLGGLPGPVPARGARPPAAGRGRRAEPQGRAAAALAHPLSHGALRDRAPDTGPGPTRTGPENTSGGSR